MTGLDENCLRNLKSSEILKQDFLRCDSKENISEKQNLIQKTFLKASTDNEPICANQPIYETIDELIIQALYSEPVDNIEPASSEPTYVSHQPIYETLHFESDIESQQKIESTPEKSSLTIEGSFKKRDAKNLQRIKDTTKILTIYDPGQVNFDVQFNLYHLSK